MTIMPMRITNAFIVGIVACCVRTSLLCAEDSHPFVIGFERFGRHQDVSDQEAGSLLISELNCTSCHAADRPELAPKRGPRLQGAGNRLRGDWIRTFSAAPGATHAGTTMPDVLHGLDEDEREEAASSIRAYLSTQVEAFPVLKAGGALPVVHEFWKKGDSKRGSELYHTIGCVACHAPDPEYQVPSSVPSPIDKLIDLLDPEDLEEMGLARAARRVDSIPHGDLREKYSSRSLSMFLLDPSSARPDSRMPALRLQPADAADITAYLMRDQPIESEIEPVTFDALQVQAGQRMFQQFRCANCHDTKPSVSPSFAKPLASLQVDAERNCLNRPSENMPRYSLDAAQVSAIVSRLQQFNEAKELTASQLVQHRMLQLNCYACHERLRKEDGETLGGVGRYRKPYFETVGQIDLGDEGRLPPPLTGVGRKLLPSALESVFTTKATPRRPFMTIRMPVYPEEGVQTLVELLPRADETETAAESKVFGDPSGLAEIGRELVNTGCVECHPFRGESLPGAIGVDLHEIQQRVHPQWFLDFLRNPGELKTRTRMPTFFPDGKSGRPELLDGDVDRQIAAIWYYLKKCDPLPQKIDEAMSKDFELVPGAHPIILRTFMREAGNHAIAVGLPGGLNFAFDAEQVQLAIAWKGRFLDARSTWFERFAPPAEPLGEAVIRFPAAFPFDLGANIRGSDRSSGVQNRSIKFAGYRIDSSGIPVFLYQFSGWDVEDRMESANGDALLRTWTFRRSARSPDEEASQLAWIVHEGRQLERVSPTSVVDENGLAVSVLSGAEQPGEVLQLPNRQQWVIPLSPAQSREVKVEYRW